MVFFEESNPYDVDIDDLLTALRLHFKNVRANDLKFIYHGTYNVFEFKKYILRVPDVELRNEEGIQLIQDETTKLKNLSDFLSVSIPQPVKVSLNEKMPFMVYEKLPGVPLSSVFHSLTPQYKKNIALHIAEFLNQFHSPTLLHQVNSKIFQTNFQTSEYKHFWETRFSEIQEKVFPLINSIQKFWIQNNFETFLENPANFRFKPTLTHCDFDMSNILVNPEKSIITGIVDFEETKAWDPAADLLFYEDPLFQQKLLSAYSFSESNSLQNRMKFLQCRTFAPYITWGLDHNKHSMVKFGLIKMERLRKEFP
ncbi:MAG: phosphotransferase family protein [Promethearchaeota archaeon]